jgi:hypothetical protein
MVIAGIGFGVAVLRARLLPTWTAVAVMVGVVLVALAQSMPDSMQLIAAGVRDLGFAGMGAALLTTAQRAGTVRQTDGPELRLTTDNFIPLDRGCHSQTLQSELPRRNPVDTYVSGEYNEIHEQSFGRADGADQPAGQ